MNEANLTKAVELNDEYTSKAGYVFSANEYAWQLSKNNTVYVGPVINLLEASIAEGYIKTLVHYSINYSASHVNNINDRMMHFLRTTKSSNITVVELINYRSQLTKNTEWYLGVIRGFLIKWHELDYPGISNEVIELFGGWTLKGNIKGDVIKRLDPLKGPLSDLELQAFNEGAVQAFEKGKITLTELALGLAISNTGRRPIQISHLRIKDILKGKNKKDELIYLLNVPRAKQRASSFREQFKQFAIQKELWAILTAQANYVLQSIRNSLGTKLQKEEELELPLFPDMKLIASLTSAQHLKITLKNEELHIKAQVITETCRTIVDAAQVHSERTGDLLNISSNRFRYTTGTRAAREGFGEMVIAELLDHSDTQNAGVYIENIPEHVENLDKAVGHQLARYAQAFAGVLVDAEAHAKRGNDLSSRIKIDAEGIGTCGSYGFCGANVPIPCYTCMHFQPWLDGPHEIVYEELINERQRLLNVTGDKQIAAVNDRSILAVADVIKRCQIRKEELVHG